MHALTVRWHWAGRCSGLTAGSLNTEPGFVDTASDLLEANQTVEVVACKVRPFLPTFEGFVDGDQ